MPDTRNISEVIDSLYRISSLVSSTEDPVEALRYILEEIMRVLSPTSASISLINPDTGRLDIEVQSGLPGELEETSLRIGEGITGWVALHGKPLIVDDVTRVNGYVRLNPDIRSEMAVPMSDQGTVIGVVNVDSASLNAFDDDALKILTLLTNEATKVVSKLWLIRQLKTKADQLQGLVNVGQRLGGSLQLQGALDYLTGESLKLFQCRMAAIFLLNPDGNTMRLASLHDREKGKQTLQTTLHANNSAVGACIQFRKIVELPNMANTDEGHFQELIRDRGLVAMIACHIITDDGVIGTLHAYTDTRHRFNNDERNIFQAIANIGAVAIQNARLYARVFSSEELLRKNEKLTTLGLLAAEIAHEIRNPLTVIKLLFDSLQLEFPSHDERGKDAAIIREKLDQLEETVSRVLDFGKSRQDMHARYDFHQLIADTLALIRLKCSQNRIEVEYHPWAEPLHVEGNKGQLQQAVLNLLLNSIEAIDPAAGGSIKLRSLRETMDGQAYIVLYVEDTGSGISPEYQDRIFNSFLTRKTEGIGLGLAISKRIMKSHRGDITLEETGPRGTIFKCRIPEK